VTSKIEAMDGDLPQPFAYGNVFAREEVGGRPRLRVGVDEALEVAVTALTDGLRGPFRCSTSCTRLAPVQNSVDTKAQS
jgi:hypothetical protein